MGNNKSKLKDKEKQKQDDILPLNKSNRHSLRISVNIEKMTDQSDSSDVEVFIKIYLYRKMNQLMFVHGLMKKVQQCVNLLQLQLYNIIIYRAI